MAPKQRTPSNPTPVDPVMLETFSFQLSKGDLRRVQIIEAAISSLAGEPFSTGVFEKVSKRLQIRRSLVDYYFKSQEELLGDAVKWVISSAQKSTVSALAEAVTPVERIDAVIRGAFAWVKGHPEQVHVFILLQFFRAQYPAVRRLLGESFEAGQARIASIARQIRPRLGAAEAEGIARSVQAMIFGAIHQAALLDTKGLSRLEGEVRASVRAVLGVSAK